MIPSDLYFASLDKGVRLFTDGKELRFQGPKGALREQDLVNLREQREDLIDFISGSTHINDYHPLSFNQKSLWFEYLASPRSHSYNILFPLVIDGNLPKELIEKAMGKLQTKYPLLRSQIEIKGNGKQPFWFDKNITLPPITDLPSSDLTGITSFCQECFDLEKSFPYKVGYKSDSSETLLVFVFHHIIGDALSFRYFFDDFFLALEQDVSGEDKAYQEFTDKQYELYFDKSRRDMLNQNLSRYLGCVPSEVKLPRDYPRNKDRAGKTISFSLSAREYGKLEKFSGDLRAKKGTLVLSVFERFLKGITGEASPVYAMATPGRTGSFGKESFGYYVNPVICSASKCKHTSAEETVKEVRLKSFDSQSFQDYPWTMVLEDLEYKRVPRANPGFQVLFNYIGDEILKDYTSFFMPQEKNRLINNKYSVRNIYLPQQEGQFDMTFEAYDDGEDLTVFLKYDENLFSEKTIANLAQYAKELIGYFVNGDLPAPKEAHKNWAKLNRSQTIIKFSGNYTVTPFLPHFAEWLRISKDNWKFSEASYNQTFQLLLNREEDFIGGESTINVLFLTLAEWKENNNISEELIDAVRNYNSSTAKPLFLFFTRSKDPSDGEREIAICEKLNNLSRVYAFSASNIESLYPHLASPLNHSTYASGHIPYTEEYYAAAASFAYRSLYSFGRKTLKALVIDGDNTLWKGILGEDGYEGLLLEECHKNLQRKIREWQDKGILVCLSSKNNQADLDELWNNRKDFLIGKEDFTIIKANWNPKSENIKDMAQQLNLGLDSFLFVDDNPAELLEVSSHLPKVHVVSAINGGVHIGEFVDHLWAFDLLKVTQEDKIRGDFYKTDVKRKSLESHAGSYLDFIRSLQLKIDISLLKDNDIPRASQLTYRTNQFNFRTKRLKENELAKEIEGGSYYWSVRVSDRFGDYGFVGLMGIKKDLDIYKLDNFLLSCRALGKGIEYQMMNRLGEFLIEKGTNNISIDLIPSERNQPARDFFKKIFSQFEENDNSMCALSSASALFNLRIIESQNPKSHETALHTKKAKQQETNSYESAFLEKCLYESGPSYYKAFSENAVSPSLSDKSDEDLKAFLISLWSLKLGHSDFTTESSFFEVGGKSVMIPGMLEEIRKQGNNITIVDFFIYPSINSLIRNLTGGNKQQAKRTVTKSNKARRAMKNFKQKRRN